MKWVFTILNCEIVTEIVYTPTAVTLTHGLKYCIGECFFFFHRVISDKTAGPDSGDANAKLSSTIFLFWLSFSIIWKIHLPPTPQTRLYFSLSSMYKKDANYQCFSQKKDFQKPENFEVMKSDDSATTNFGDELCMFSFPSSSQL